MSKPQVFERMLFTFQSNGENHGKRLVEASAEHLLVHEAPVGPEAEKRCWFGPEDDVRSVFAKVGFTELDLDGVLAGLRVNRVETREVDAVSDDLQGLGFMPKANSLPAVVEEA